MTPELKKYEAVIRPLMSKKRFLHSVNVAKAAVELAAKFGCDEDRTYTAAILHDCMKETEREELYKMFCSCPFPTDPVEAETYKLWHAPAGAYYVKETLKIEDTEIQSAIRFHTVGKAKMTMLEQIIYLADMISEERDYPGIEKYRKIVFDDLDNAMYVMMRWSMMKTLDPEGKTIPISTLEGYNYYSKFKKESFL